MQELRAAGKDIRPHRLKAEHSRLMYDMLRILRPSLHRMTARKNMVSTQREDVEQHAAIAIMKALENWDPQKATFSTHVHWQIRAELQALQWFEHPERRKLVLQQPLRFLELDRPYPSPEGHDSVTLADTLTAANAVEDVESSARRHIAMHYFERVFSNHIVKQMISSRAKSNDQEEIEKKQSLLMRNRWIYICKVLHMEDPKKIAERHGISRERVRQIVNEIDDGLRGQLPRCHSKTGEVTDVARQAAPEQIHQDWEGMLIGYYMETGIDTRLLNLEAPLPTRPQAEERHATTVVVEIGASTPDTHTGQPEEHPTNVVEIRRRTVAREIVDGARIAVAAGAMLMAMTANAGAQSRAVPPQAGQRQTSAAETAETADFVASPTTARTRPEVHPATGSVRPLAQVVTRKPSWGVRMATYERLDVLRKASIQERRAWSWINGLDAAYEGGGASGFQVVYGPLTREQAGGLCHEARRYEKPCSVVTYGTTRS